MLFISTTYLVYRGYGIYSHSGVRKCCGSKFKRPI